MKKVLLVNIWDNPIGKKEKKLAHSKPCLHRAFSVFLYNGNKILIQKRAKNKYHSGGLWANACCSHPVTTDIEKEASLRLYEELGIANCAPHKVFSFIYMAKFAENLYEYEVDHVLLAEYNGEIILNPEEAEEAKWVDIDRLATDIVKNPQKYTVWFLSCAPEIIKILKK